MQQKPNTKLRDLLKSNKAKTRKLSELSKTEQNRLAKLNGMLDELRRGEKVKNRRLGTWLTEAEYESFKSDVLAFGIQTMPYNMQLSYYSYSYKIISFKFIHCFVDLLKIDWVFPIILSVTTKLLVSCYLSTN